MLLRAADLGLAPGHSSSDERKPMNLKIDDDGRLRHASGQNGGRYAEGPARPEAPGAGLESLGDGRRLAVIPTDDADHSEGQDDRIRALADFPEATALAKLQLEQERMRAQHREQIGIVDRNEERALERQLQEARRDGRDPDAVRRANRELYEEQRRQQQLRQKPEILAMNQRIRAAQDALAAAERKPVDDLDLDLPEPRWQQLVESHQRKAERWMDEHGDLRPETPRAIRERGADLRRLGEILGRA